jgi:hypothetical protein
MQTREKMELTLVAFHGSKPEPLAELINLLHSALDSQLGSAFIGYTIDQVHATIIGLQGRRVRPEILKTNAVDVNNVSSAINLEGLFLFLQEIPPLHIQMGGYSSLNTYPFTSRGLHPYIRSFAINDTLAVSMGWPVAGDLYPMTLDSLRRDCKQFNALHKYHRKIDDIDNDFFIVLGHVDPESVSKEKAASVQSALRQLLAEQEPLDLVVQPDDLSVVAYIDSELPIATSVRYSLVEALVRVEELKLCYRESITVKS